MTDLSMLPPGQLMPSQHTGATATSSHEMAVIQAASLVAIGRPRDIDESRARVMKDCLRPGFAEAARYEIKNRGSGLSIKFALSILRNWGNLRCTAITVDDTDEAITVRVTVSDLETNASDSRDVTIAKTVERKREPKDGHGVVGTRFNSYGDELFIIRATSEDVLGKVNAQISKAKRTLLLEFVPFDILEECEQQIIATNHNSDAEDPDRAKRRLLDGFAKLNVFPSDLAEYLGKSLNRLQAADLSELRGIWTSLQSGEFTWEEVMEEKKPTVVAEGVTNAMDAKNPEMNQEEIDHAVTGLGNLADELDAEDAKPKLTKQGIIDRIAELKLTDPVMFNAANDIAGREVKNFHTLTHQQLTELLERLS